MDLATREYLLVQSLDAWLFAQPRVINGRRKSVYPVVLERMKLADGLWRRLQALGLKRRAKRVPRLAEYVEQRDAERAAAEGTQGAEPASPPEADVDPDDVV